ncbi:C-GCAxxG-C-C family protein, partial [Chloroflexota bacterium]
VSVLAGGLYESRHICGALLGGMVVISLEFGRADFLEPGGPKEAGLSKFTYAERFTRELYRRFKEHFKVVICSELLEQHFGKPLTPVDRTNPMEVERAKSGEVYSILSTYCCQMVEKAAEITADIILRERRAKATTA